MKGLSPKLQLDRKDFATGSIPTTARLSSDGRTGVYSVGWDDRNTIPFREGFSTPNELKEHLLGYWKMSSLYETENTGFVPRRKTSGQIRFAPVYLSDEIGSISDPANELSVDFSNRASPLFVESDLGFNAFGPHDRTFLMKIGEGSRVKLSKDIAKHFTFAESDTQLGTICFWAYVGEGTDLNDEDIVLLHKVDEIGFFTGSFLVYVDKDTRRVVTEVYSNINNNNFRLRVTSDAVPVNQWTHIAITYDGTPTTGFLYVAVNGSYVDNGYSDERGGDPNLDSDDFDLFLVEPYDGSAAINDLCFFDRPLVEEDLRVVMSVRSSLTLDDFGVTNLGLPVDSKWIENTEQTSTLTIPNGNVVGHLADSQTHFTPGQDLTPFRDFWRPEVDGKSTQDPFFATGSTIQEAGEGFDQPLWSKSKIEFDFTVSEEASVGFRSGSGEGDDHAMMYFSPRDNNFVKVGSANRWDHYEEVVDNHIGFSPAEVVGTLALLSQKAILFQPTLGNDPDDVWISQRPWAGTFFNIFPKFNRPKGDTQVLVSLKDKISGPFVLEKLVVEFSGSHFSRDAWSSDTGVCINTFFVLNQRDFKTPGVEVSSFFIESESGTKFRVIGTSAVTSSLDIVAFNQFAVAGYTEEDSNTEKPVVKRELAVLNKRGVSVFFPTSTDIEDTKRFLLEPSTILISGSAQTANATNLLAFSTNPAGLKTTTLNFETAAKVAEIPCGWNGGRNDRNVFGIPDDRSLVRNVTTPKRIETSQELALSADTLEISSPTPYILQPTDNLIFGFQCAYMLKGLTEPFINSSGSVNRGPTLTIHEGPFRVTLYGSLMSEQKEYHDTVNQHLTSIAIKETIK